MNRLEIHIATHGGDGLTTILNRRYPVVDGVFYRIGWQNGRSSVHSDNMIVSGNKARSLTENRNHLISECCGDIILFGDNDISYSSEQISDIPAVFDCHSEVDFICFKLDRSDKIYPEETFDIAKPKPGYFPSSCEIAVKKSFIDKHNIRFDTRFGLGARYICFEEMLFVNSLLKKGAKGIYLPIVIGRHESKTSTGTRLDLKHKVEFARGAALALTVPLSAPLRLTVQAVRNSSLWHFINGIRGYVDVLFRPNRHDI